MRHSIRQASRILCLAAAGSFFAGTARSDAAAPRDGVLTGKDALGDWTTDAPGVRRKITVDDLATPYDTPSAREPSEARRAARGGLAQGARGVQGDGVRHRAAQPAGDRPRPNGDLFVAESRATACASSATPTATASPR